MQQLEKSSRPKDLKLSVKHRLPCFYVRCTVTECTYLRRVWILPYQRRPRWRQWACTGGSRALSLHRWTDGTRSVRCRLTFASLGIATTYNHTCRVLSTKTRQGDSSFAIEVLRNVCVEFLLFRRLLKEHLSDWVCGTQWHF